MAHKRNLGETINNKNFEVYYPILRVYVSFQMAQKKMYSIKNYKRLRNKKKRRRI